jgi:hypothetical protein
VGRYCDLHAVGCGQHVLRGDQRPPADPTSSRASDARVAVTIRDTTDQGRGRRTERIGVGVEPTPGTSDEDPQRRRRRTCRRNPSPPPRGGGLWHRVGVEGVRSVHGSSGWEEPTWARRADPSTALGDFCPVPHIADFGSAVFREPDVAFRANPASHPSTSPASRAHEGWSGRAPRASLAVLS